MPFWYKTLRKNPKSLPGRGMQTGQATVEAALLIPILLFCLLLLIQPGILLYDLIVMKGAAAQGCRSLITRPTSEATSDAAYINAITYQLGAIPQQDNFHVHSPSCSYNVVLEGNESSDCVRVRITTKAKPLPLFGPALSALGAANSDGTLTLVADETMRTHPAWVGNSPSGSNPHDWIQQWDQD